MFDFIKNLFKPKTDVAKLVEEGAVIIDVRSKGEFQTGHIKGSLNIPVDNIKREATSIKKLNKPVITVCQSGTRSMVAKSILNAAGIQVYNGGAWAKLNRQLQPL